MGIIEHYNNLYPQTKRQQVRRYNWVSPSYAGHVWGEYVDVCAYGNYRMEEMPQRNPLVPTNNWSKSFTY